MAKSKPHKRNCDDEWWNTYHLLQLSLAIGIRIEIRFILIWCTRERLEWHIQYHTFIVCVCFCVSVFLYRSIEWVVRVYSNVCAQCDASFSPFRKRIQWPLYWNIKQRSKSKMACIFVEILLLFWSYCSCCFFIYLFFFFWFIWEREKETRILQQYKHRGNACALY